MGIYINPPNMSKEEWLIEHATNFKLTAPALHYYPSTDEVIVCLVNNPGFSSAAILYDALELKRFVEGMEGRGHSYHYVPRKDLQPFLFGKEIEGAPND